MAPDLHERYGGWALVTGASSGLGEIFAEELAARGFPVALVARRRERLDEIAARIARERGVQTLVVEQDLAAPDAGARIEAAMADRPVGVLVANAGFGFSGRFADREEASDASMVTVNCTSVVDLTHRLLRPMLARRRGGVIVVSSTAGFQPTPWFALYGATKAFVLHFAEALAVELRGSGVDVLALCPGETRTEFATHAHFGKAPGGMDPRPVVVAALRGLGRRTVVVPGAVNKLTAFSHRLLPRRWVAAITGAVLARALLRTTSAALRRGPRQ